MSKLITVILVQIAQFASVIGFYLTAYPINKNDDISTRPLLHFVTLSAYFIATAYVLYKEITQYFDSQAKEFTDKNEINDYMKKWISKGGRVAIFSRDLSWAQEDEPQIQDILLKKSARNELNLFVEEETRFTQRLKAAGAQVRTYGSLRYVPRSRFTIIDFEQAGARIAVGRKNHHKHVIEEFQEGAHPCFSVAEDLLKMLIAYNEKP